MISTILSWFIMGDAQGNIATRWDRVALVVAVAVAIVAMARSV